MYHTYMGATHKIVHLAQPFLFCYVCMALPCDAPIGNIDVCITRTQSRHRFTVGEWKRKYVFRPRNAVELSKVKGDQNWAFYYLAFGIFQEFSAVFHRTGHPDPNKILLNLSFSTSNLIFASTLWCALCVRCKPDAAAAHDAGELLHI